MNMSSPHEATHGHHESNHGHHDMGSVDRMAVSATLHCLTGCAIGEIVGLIIGTALGLSNLTTIALAVALAFAFGYSLSTLPLLKAGLALGAAFSVVLAADTLSILTMEIVDNVVMAIIPGAMNAGLVNPIFWVGMMIALTAAFFAAYPVNRVLLQRGKGHALTHEYHGAEETATGTRRFIPSFSTGALIAVIVAFMLGGLVVSVADELTQASSAPSHAKAHLPAV
jgi:preprotein translocase subunit SecG